jgi:hypothetical protein
LPQARANKAILKRRRECLLDTSIQSNAPGGKFKNNEKKN